MNWLWASAVVMAATAVLHSLFGERRLIVPLLATDTALIARVHVRRLIRFAWHATSLLMLTAALTIVWPGTPREVIMVTGGAWLLAGLSDAAITRGKHIGWPFLMLAGVLAMMGAG